MSTTLALNQVGTMTIEKAAPRSVDVRDIPMPRVLIDARTRMPISVQGKNEGVNQGLTKSFRLDVVNSDTYRALICRFEGRVTDIDEAADEFCAVLHDKAGVEEDHVGTFALSDVSAQDEDLIFIGAIFYFTLYRTRLPGGTITYDDALRFQRCPRLTIRQIERIERTATSIWQAFPQLAAFRAP